MAVFILCHYLRAANLSRKITYASRGEWCKPLLFPLQVCVVNDQCCYHSLSESYTCLQDHTWEHPRHGKFSVTLHWWQRTPGRTYTRLRKTTAMASGKSGLPAPFLGGEGATRFFTRFEVACRLNKWESETDKALHVLPLLGDSVFDFASTLSGEVRDKYSELKKAVIKQYDSAILTVCVAEQFTDRKLKSSETLTEFMMDLKSLSEKAYGDLPADARERLVRDQFTKSLPMEIRRHILLQPTLTTSTAVLDEALKVAEVERGVTATRNSTVAAVSSATDPLLEAIQKLTEKVSLLEDGQAAMVARVQHYSSDSQPTRAPTRPYQFQGSCYKCKERGHMARNCPQKESVCDHCKNPGHQSQNCAIRGKKITDF